MTRARRRHVAAVDSIVRVIEPGAEAPDFELPDQDGRAIKLSDFRGKAVVLYFYPKAEGYCTLRSNGSTGRAPA